MGVFSNFNNPTINQGLGLNPRGGEQTLPTGCVTLWLSQQELFSLPALSEHGAEPGALGHSSLSLQLFFSFMGAENTPREQLPLVPSAQPGTALPAPAVGGVRRTCRVTENKPENPVCQGRYFWHSRELLPQ